MALAGVLLLGGCADVLGPRRYVGTETWEIAPQLVVCYPPHGPGECLSVRVNGTGPWQPTYSPLIGFTFEPGHEYVIRVHAFELRNPPMDSSSREYYLAEVLRKRAVSAPSVTSSSPPS